MTPADQDPVDQYLRRLEAATRDLPPEVRDDLLTDVHTHLQETRRRATSSAELRSALERLGPPEAIAAEARGGPDAGVSPVASTTSSSARDVTTVIALLFGPLLLSIPLGIFGAALGWATGLGLLWSSRSWTAGEKLTAALVWPGGFLTPIFLGTLSTRVCTSVETSEGVSTVECTGFALPIWLGIPVLIVVSAAPVVVAWVLLRRADARRAAEQRGLAAARI
jgi:uncharacterized membrane protein